MSHRLSLGRHGPVRHERLGWSEKFARLSLRLKDPEWRRYGKTLLLGKLLGFGALLAVIVIVNVLPSLLAGTAHAQATQPATQAAVSPVMPADLTDLAKNPVINPLNTVWT